MEVDQATNWEQTLPASLEEITFSYMRAMLKQRGIFSAIPKVWSEVIADAKHEQHPAVAQIINAANHLRDTGRLQTYMERCAANDMGVSSEGLFSYLEYMIHLMLGDGQKNWTNVVSAMILTTESCIRAMSICKDIIPALIHRFLSLIRGKGYPDWIEGQGGWERIPDFQYRNFELEMSVLMERERNEVRGR